MTEVLKLSDGQSITFRPPYMEDARGLLDLIVDSTKTSSYLLMDERDIYHLDIEAEKIWLSEVMQNPNVLMLVAVHNGSIVGNAELRIRPLLKTRHWAELGITIKSSFRRKGIGKQMILHLIELGKRVKGLEFIRISVFENNKVALNLYKQLGFEVCGRIENAFKYADGSYDTELILTKRVD